MVCKKICCSEFPDILDKVGRKRIRRRRRKTQVVAKRYAFHANAIRGETKKMKQESSEDEFVSYNGKLLL